MAAVLYFQSNSVKPHFYSLRAICDENKRQAEKNVMVRFFKGIVEKTRNERSQPCW